jgi:hypothetical protein
MNKKQLIVVLSALALFILSELFPPLSYKDEQSRRRSAGYHFFYNPPTMIEVRPEVSSASSGQDGQVRQYRIGGDKPRLLAQRIILLFGMLGLVLLLERRKSKLKVAFGIISLGLGFAVSGLYVLYISGIG